MHRVAEHLLALHPQIADGAGRGRPAIDIEQVVMRAVGVEMGREHAALRRPAALVASRSSTTAPAPSPNSTQVPRSVQSRSREKVSAPITSARLRLARADEIVGDGQRIDEARAHRLDVEGGSPRSCPARACTLVAVAGKGIVGRGRRQHDQVDVAAVDARPRPSASRGRVERQIGGHLAVGAATWRWRMPVRCDDPLVGGVDVWPARRW